MLGTARYLGALLVMREAELDVPGRMLAAVEAAEHEAEITLAASRRCAIVRMSERGTELCLT